MSVPRPFTHLAATIIGIAGLGVVCAAACAASATFSLHKALDSYGDHHLAMTYLVPAGWKATDKIVWDLQQRQTPLQITTVTTSPDDRFIVRWLNTAGFAYGHLGNRGDRGTVPPEHPSELLVDTFKRSHPGVDLDVVDRQETPATSIFKESDTTKSRAFMCSVKLRYTLNGVPMLTKSGFKFDGYEMGRDPRFTNGFWSITNITSVTGPEAEFPRAMKLGAVVLSSRQWDPQFFQLYQDVCYMFLKQVQDEGQARLDGQFAAMQKQYRDLSRSNMGAFKAQMAAKDKSTRNFCDYVLDRQRYTDGHTEFIMPSGYSRAMTNGSQYVLTNDPGAGGAGWHDLTKVP